MPITVFGTLEITPSAEEGDPASPPGVPLTVEWPLLLNLARVAPYAIAVLLLLWRGLRDRLAIAMAVPAAIVLAILGLFESIPDSGLYTILHPAVTAMALSLALLWSFSGRLSRASRRQRLTAATWVTALTAIVVLPPDVGFQWNIQALTPAIATGLFSVLTLVALMTLGRRYDVAVDSRAGLLVWLFIALALVAAVLNAIVGSITIFAAILNGSMPSPSPSGLGMSLVGLLIISAATAAIACAVFVPFLASAFWMGSCRERLEAMLRPVEPSAGAAV